MALASLKQADFGGGIYRGRTAPKNAVYDAVNMLVDDEGFLYKRGAAVISSASPAGSTLSRLASIYFPGPKVNRVLAWNASHFYAYDGSSNPVQVATPSDLFGRPASVGGVSIFAGSSSLYYYGGSLSPTSYSTGTLTMTQGSTTAVGSGTAFVANLDPGMMLSLSAVPTIGPIVASVTDDTHFELTAPWDGGSGAISGWIISPLITLTLSNIGIQPLGPMYVAAAGSGLPRLLLATGNRVYESATGRPSALSPTAYHELPSNAVINGIEGYGDSAVIFTNVGPWRIDNLSLDLVDDAGNIQQTVEQISKDLILWGDLGIDAWKGNLIVPGVDDVHAMGLNGSTTPITAGDNGKGGILEKIRPLYRSYVAAGYTPGMGCVHHGHYFLPIVNGSTVIDVLVCRLDRGAAWTRWDGISASPAFAARVGGDVPSPHLIGLSGGSILNATDCLNPSAANTKEADNFTRQAIVETIDFPTSAGSQPSTVRDIRATYVLTDNGAGSLPIVAPETSSDEDAGTYASPNEIGVQGGGTGWVLSDGTKYSWGRVTKKRQRLRVRLTQTQPCASWVLRCVELTIRPTGKQ